MKIKELKEILKDVPDDCDVVIKDYLSASELWKPRSVKYVERSKLENYILID